MASIKEHKDGYRAQVFTLGVRDSKVFRTKKEATNWASSRETDIRKTAKLEKFERHTLQEAFDKFIEKVVVKHKSASKETASLLAIERQLPMSKPIGEITTDILAEWRDSRLESVKGSSVLRELKLLNGLFEVARKEWKWISKNPLRDMDKPSDSRHRTRTITRREIRKMLEVMQHSGRQPKTAKQAMAVLFLVALRTGMRARELCELAWDRVYSKHCHVIAKGIGEVTRDIPLNRKTRRLIDRMRGYDRIYVFGSIISGTLSTQFIRHRKRAGLSGFTFHDSRHTAATWLAKKLDVLTLCKMFGWKNPQQAMTYYNPTAADIADRLD